MRPVEVLQQLADGAKNERDRILAATALSNREVRLAQLANRQKVSAETLEQQARWFLLSCATAEERDVIRTTLARATARLEADEIAATGERLVS